MAAHRPRGHRGRRPRASRPAAPSPTGPSTASRCPAPSPPRTSCSASAGCSASSAPACSSWRPAGALGEDLAAPEREMDWMRRLADGHRPARSPSRSARTTPTRRRGSGCSTSPPRPRADGAPVRPQVHGRTVSLLLGFQTFHPLAFTAGVGRGRPRAAALAASRWPASTADPELRARLVRRRRRCCATTRSSRASCTRAASSCSATRPTTSPGPSAASPAIAAARGVDEWELLLDLLLERRRPRAAQRPGPQLHRRHPRRRAARCSATRRPAFGLGDGGAHAGQTCDASTTTFLLSHWARDRRPRPAHRRGRRAQDDRRPPPRSTASATGACSPRASSATPTSSTTTTPAAAPARAGGRPARRRQPPHPAGRRLRRHRQGRRRSPSRRGEDTGARPGPLLRGAR